MKRRCYEQVKKFSWDIAARQLLEAYVAVAQGQIHPARVVQEEHVGRAVGRL
jgi:hypothetical protein